MAAPFDWSAGIKLTFDREITVDPEIIVSSLPEKVARASYTAFGSSYNSSGYEYDKAYDGIESTRWRTSNALPQWIGAQFTAAQTLSKARALLDALEPPLQVKVQGSDDGVNYTDVATTTWDGLAGWHEIEWEAATYIYWRLYVVTKKVSNMSVYELEWCEPANQYAVTGWDVYANEPTMSPDGEIVVNHYTVQKVTYGDTHYEIIVWLKLTDRMMYPIGDVTVDFSGTLIGAGPAYVQPFIETFTPSNITKMFNPNDVENVEVDLSIESETVLVYYRSYQTGYENVEVDLSVESTTYHVDDIPE